MEYFPSQLARLIPIIMKKLIVLLLLFIGAVTLVPTEASARDRRSYRSYDRYDCDRGNVYYRRPVVYRTYYRPAPVYYAPRTYSTRYYNDCAPVYYSRPRTSFSFTFAR